MMHNATKLHRNVNHSYSYPETFLTIKRCFKADPKNQTVSQALQPLTFSPAKPPERRAMPSAQCAVIDAYLAWSSHQRYNTETMNNTTSFQWYFQEMESGSFRLWSVIVIALLLLSNPAMAHDDGGSHGHDGGLGRIMLAERDTLVFSIGATHCNIRYLGSNEIGYELESFLYEDELFEKQTSSDYHLVQSGESFQTGEVVWLLSTKTGSDIILEAVEQP